MAVVEMIMTMNLVQGVSPKKKNFKFLNLLIMLFPTSDIMVEHLYVSFVVPSNCVLVGGRS